MGGGVKLSTPIDLKTIESEIASLAGRASATPISMESLWNEVQNLKAQGKYEIVTLTGNGTTFPFDEKFKDYDFLVFEWYGRAVVGGNYLWQVDANKNNIIGHSDGRGTTSRINPSIKFSKSGNNIVATCSGCSLVDNTIKVLFYK